MAIAGIAVGHALMGRFETFVYGGGQWADAAMTEPWMRIELHDSSIATVTFAPAMDAQGLVHLGFQPRDYFEDSTASADVDIPNEIAALARWSIAVSDTSVDITALESAIAADGVEEPPDVFVEDAVIRFVRALGLPVPPDLLD